MEDNLTQFQKNWIASTLAPESIKTAMIKNIPLHELTNPDKTRKIYVAELNGKLFVSTDIDNWVKNAKVCDTFSDAVDVIVPILNLPQHVKV